MGTGPPVSIGSSRLLLELLESLPESSESLLLEEVELELGCPSSPSVAGSPLPVGREGGTEDSTLEGGLGGAGMDANIAAVEDVEAIEVICGSLVGVACDCLLRPVTLSGSDTMSGLLVIGTGGWACLARATALVIFAAATAETFVDALVVFFTTAGFTADVLVPALVATVWRRAVALAIPCLVSWELRAEEEGAVGLAAGSTTSL